MSTSARVSKAFEDLPLDAFDLDTTDIQVETLTTGHGMTETAASGPCWRCCCSC